MRFKTLGLLLTLSPLLHELSKAKDCGHFINHYNYDMQNRKFLSTKPNNIVNYWETILPCPVYFHRQ